MRLRIPATPPPKSGVVKTLERDVAEILEDGAQIGLFGPRDPAYWTLWIVSFCLLLNMVSFILLDVYFLQGSWALVQTLPFVWFLQGYFILECVHISGTETRDSKKNSSELTRCVLSGILATFFLVSCVFPLVVMELEQCGSLDDAAAENLHECFQAVKTSISADLSADCQAHADITTRATGICPEIRFGSGSGTAWKAWSMISILLFIFGNCLAIWKLPWGGRRS